ncbi:hypothetical protein NKR23_g8963 [Pleurostoma richardsiae]|uniref:BTB domain-containing protein n=1 Tax=Pleurostoma richardsiae TaxID=41990 RepID=A0AA38R5B9_9PEZI|nr:hypothetical protein NKR23_g8963 [Pleurostoma richardsiae]
MNTSLEALLFPADGTAIRLVKYDTKQREEGDGTVDFYEHLPDLRPWFGEAFPERDFADFYVDSKEQRGSYGALVRSDNQSIHGAYCLYYTTAPALPLNETCRRLVGNGPPEERLFWRGDVLLVRYAGELGMGHEYIGAPHAVSSAAEQVIRSMYENQALEKKRDSDLKFELEMQGARYRFPDMFRAEEAGAVERFRTGMTNEEDADLIGRLSRYVVRWPSGSTRRLLDLSTALCSAQNFDGQGGRVNQPEAQPFAGAGLDPGAPAPRPSLASDVRVSLQVGERRFTTTKETLVGESHFFASLLSGRWKNALEDGSYFIDADPVLFEHILRFLRRGVYPLFFDVVKGHDHILYHSLQEEARYFGIPRLEDWLEQKRYLEAVRVDRTLEIRDEGTIAGQDTAAKGDAVDHYDTVPWLRMLVVQKRVTYMPEICVARD